MQAFKTLLIVAVLSAVAYCVYMAITGARDVEPPPGADTEFQGAPQIQLPSLDGPQSTTPAAVSAPQVMTSAPLVVQPQAGASGDAPHYAVPDHQDAGAAPPFVAPSVGPPSGVPSEVAPFAVPDATGPPGAGSFGTPSAAYPSSAGGYGTPDTMTASSAPPAAESMPPSNFATDYAAAGSLLQENRLDSALLLLSRWYDRPELSEQQQHELLVLLNQLAGTVIYSREHVLLPAYEVQPGDTLERVAQHYRVPWQLLAKINGTQDPNQLRPGDKLKVVQGPFDASVNLRTQRLTLFLGGRFAGCFSAGIGAENTTPEGEFNVKVKTPNPNYYGPDRVVEAGDPNNPLGKYWIGLGDQLGIHGTNDPQSIGRADSRGCIRLSPRDIEDVYDMMTVESRVRIYR